MSKLPLQLLKSLNKLEHFNETDFIKAHDEENKLTSLRLNPFKKVDLDFKLDKKVLWNESGFYLKNRPYFTYDPLFHAGCYYVQEAGSMFLEFILKNTLDFNNKLRVLDVCAAPGGKSTLINSLLNGESLLVSNEIIKSRADVLAQNLSKWGTCNSIVTNGDPSRFTEIHAFFDCIVVDAPCSGSGLFRKQPDAINEWSEDSVKACGIRQKRILEDVLPALKDSGILIYSTCSYSIEENENIVESLINSHGLEYVPLTIEKQWNIIETQYGYRFYPHLTDSEGFFCAILRKAEGQQRPRTFRNKLEKSTAKSETDILSPFIKPSNDLLIKKNTHFHLMNNEAAVFLQAFEKQFYFKKAGVLVGEIKGKDVVPSHELALSLNVSESISVLCLDKENAVKFLKKEVFFYEQNNFGLTLIEYKNYGIGWSKILNNRVNNYLPNELRVLK